MKKKIICSVIAVVLLTIMAISSAFALNARCIECNNDSLIYRYSVNNDSYHRYYCRGSGCDTAGTASHKIASYSNRECLLCGDVIGD